MNARLLGRAAGALTCSGALVLATAGPGAAVYQNDGSKAGGSYTFLVPYGASLPAHCDQTSRGPVCTPAIGLEGGSHTLVMTYQSHGAAVSASPQVMDATERGNLCRSDASDKSFFLVVNGLSRGSTWEFRLDDQEFHKNTDPNEEYLTVRRPVCLQQLP